jgi:hypothetical protein
MKIKPGQFLRISHFDNRSESSYISVKSMEAIDPDRWATVTHLMKFETILGDNFEYLSSIQGGGILVNCLEQSDDVIPNFTYEMIEANDATHLLLMVM